MDQMMFDITDVEAKEGDVITLLGDETSIDEWAKIVGTINYELTCICNNQLVIRSFFELFGNLGFIW
jgi:alanine racemase